MVLLESFLDRVEKKNECLEAIVEIVVHAGSICLRFCLSTVSPLQRYNSSHQIQGEQGGMLRTFQLTVPSACFLHSGGSQ